MNVIQVKLHGKTSPRWRPVTYMVLSDFNERTTALQEKLNMRSSRYYYHLQNHIQIWFIAMLEWSRRFLTNCEGIYLRNITKKSWRIIVLFYSWRITCECFSVWTYINVKLHLNFQQSITLLITQSVRSIQRAISEKAPFHQRPGNVVALVSPETVSRVACLHPRRY